MKSEILTNLRRPFRSDRHHNRGALLFVFINLFGELFQMRTSLGARSLRFQRHTVRSFGRLSGKEIGALNVILILILNISFVCW